MACHSLNGILWKFELNDLWQRILTQEASERFLIEHEGFLDKVTQRKIKKVKEMIMIKKEFRW